jgi:hypothetical protein
MDTHRFVCDDCKYKTNRLNDWNKHVGTAKHNKMISGDKGDSVLCECGRLFKHMPSLTRHKKICSKPESEIDLDSVSTAGSVTSTTEKMTAELLIQLIQQNEELKTMLIEERKQFNEKQSYLLEQQNALASQQSQIMEYCKQPKTIKNNFNLNFFLNVQCKDALNISEFVNNLAIQISDVENVGKLGYVDGISRIILNALQELDMYKRPIHCTDIKKEVLFVKDEDRWDKDEDKTKLKKVISNVAQKNCQKLCAYIKPEMMMAEHPDCEKNLIMMKNVNGGNKETLEKNHDKIARIISKSVIVEEQ